MQLHHGGAHRADAQRFLQRAGIGQHGGSLRGDGGGGVEGLLGGVIRDAVHQQLVAHLEGFDGLLGLVAEHAVGRGQVVAQGDQPCLQLGHGHAARAVFQRHVAGGGPALLRARARVRLGRGLGRDAQRRVDGQKGEFVHLAGLLDAVRLLEGLDGGGGLGGVLIARRAA